MVMPKKILVIRLEGTELMSVDDVYKTFGIDDSKLANYINYGNSAKSATGDVYFDIPLD